MQPFRLPRRTLIALVAATLLFASCGSGDSTTDTAAPADSSDPVAAGMVATADGGQIDLGSLEGTDTVLWFWAPW